MNKANIFYKDIGDYLSREDKLKIVRENRSILNPAVGMTKIEPNEHGDWINFRNDAFSSFIPLEPEKKFDVKTQSFFTTHSLGIATNKDTWLYNFSIKKLEENLEIMVSFYNEQRNKFHSQKVDKKAKDFVEYKASKINWTDMFLKDLENNVIYDINKDTFCSALYRPFTMQKFCYEKQFIQRTYQQTKLFPNASSNNLLICVHGLGGKKDFSTIMTNCITDLNSLEAGAQCFPLYWYEKKENVQGSLFEKGEDDYIRRDAISDFILNQAQARYGPKVTKVDIFYYVYGILHSPGYRKTFANDLKKMLPRLPLVGDVQNFWAFSEAGRKLADIHLNYEGEAPPEEILINGEPVSKASFPENHLVVGQMKFPVKGRTDAIIYNSYITISNIPPGVYEYIVNGKSAIEWVMERYAVAVHKESGIRNDPNDWSMEHGNPRYILDLLLSVMSVSMKTVDIVAGLPGVEWGG